MKIFSKGKLKLSGLLGPGSLKYWLSDFWFDGKYLYATNLKAVARIEVSECDGESIGFIPRQFQKWYKKKKGLNVGETCARVFKKFVKRQEKEECEILARRDGRFPDISPDLFKTPDAPTVTFCLDLLLKSLSAMSPHAEVVEFYIKSPNDPIVIKTEKKVKYSASPIDMIVMPMGNEKYKEVKS